MTEETQIWVHKAEEDYKAAEILLAAPDYLFDPTRGDAQEAFDLMKEICEFILLKIR
jgi:hypothetical protein